MCILQIVSSSLWLVFYFSHSVFYEAEVISLNEVQFVSFFFCALCFWALYIKTHHSTQDHIDFLLYYLLSDRQFCILCVPSQWLSIKRVLNLGDSYQTFALEFPIWCLSHFPSCLSVRISFSLIFLFIILLSDVFLC